MDLFSDKAALNEICQKYRISRLALFGSVLKGTQKVGSDVDMLLVF
jgi:predicted nucleotidyltransferase